MNTPLNRRQFIHTSGLGLGLGFTGLQLSPVSAEEKKPAAKKPAVAKFNHYDDAKLVAGEPPAIAAGSFTIAVLPDTQKYSKVNPDGFLSQTEWIAQNNDKRNIACVLHLGDITDNNLPDQWDLAQRALTKLDDKVPYFLALGNHDYSENGSCADRTTLFNTYFPHTKFTKLSTFGGVYDKEPDRLENSFHRFSAGGKKWLVLCLEFGPRKDVIRWANEVVSKHHDHAAILVTHCYTYFDDSRYDWKQKGTAQGWNPHAYKMAGATNDDVSDGEELWQTLVSKHPNFVMTLNGHVLEDGLGRVTSEANGRQIHQMLVNFQMRPQGGDAWMRLIEMKADGSAAVCDFSPQRNECNMAEENCFNLQLAQIA